PHSISTPCALEPSWSPDGGRIACVRYSPQDVFVVDLVTGVATQVTSGSLIGNRDPAWSPDGARIAFTTYVDGHSHVAVINPDGSDPVVLTAGSQTDSHPTWSPNGRRIAFARYGGGSYQIFVMNADGTELQQITWGGFNEAPSWSPDGTRIAFDGGTSDVRTMNADG